MHPDTNAACDTSARRELAAGFFDCVPTAASWRVLPTFLPTGCTALILTRPVAAVAVPLPVRLQAAGWAAAFLRMAAATGGRAVAPACLRGRNALPTTTPPPNLHAPFTTAFPFRASPVWRLTTILFILGVIYLPFQHYAARVRICACLGTGSDLNT